ncbi:MAG: siroheme decarboxylase subunit beta [Candidatus Latescibacterota bacterium]
MNDLTSDKEKALLALIQSDFPLVNRPFRVIAKQLGLTESEIMGTVQSLQHSRVIREFGPVFDTRKLGYISTLVATKIERDRAVELSATMLTINEITHNYYREGDFNLWFTIIARDRSVLEDTIRLVEKFPGVLRVLDLPVEKMIKLNAVFGAGTQKSGFFDKSAPPTQIDEEEQGIIRVLQNGLPVVEQPFLAVAAELGMSEDDLIGKIQNWIENRAIRRFGARVNHRRMGFEVNALAVWEGDEAQAWGSAFAELPNVSHCYLRRSYPEWPYRLYTMVHAKDEAEMGESVETMRRIAPQAHMKVLRTLYELKKTSMKYFQEK